MPSTAWNTLRLGVMTSDVQRSLIGDDLPPRFMEALDDLEAYLESRDQTAGSLLMALLSSLPQERLVANGQYVRRKHLVYEVREDRDERELCFTASKEQEFSLQPDAVMEAMEASNAALMALELFTRNLKVSVTELLGLRNLSSLVSAVVVSEVQSVLGDELFVNPHQDGYPDLLPTTSAAVAYRDEVRDSARWTEKAAWTDPGFGGVEVKATAGNTPPAKRVPKPSLGQERSNLIVSFDWKAHHQETTRLLGCTWDFLDGIPTVTAAFWRNDLETTDWGSIVTPTSGGGRTTSVSVMNRAGTNKMADGWMARCTDPDVEGGLRSGRMWA